MYWDGTKYCDTLTEAQRKITSVRMGLTEKEYDNVNTPTVAVEAPPTKKRSTKQTGEVK